MSFTPPPANVLVNFTAAGRKARLIPSGYFSPNDNINFIWDIANSSGGFPNPVTPTGTIDGVNAVFVSPTAPTVGLAVFRNGLLQDPAISYTLVGSTITFNAANIPQVGDDLMVLVD